MPARWSKWCADRSDRGSFSAVGREGGELLAELRVRAGGARGAEEKRSSLLGENWSSIPGRNSSSVPGPELQFRSWAGASFPFGTRNRVPSFPWGLATALHSALAENQPVERHLLLECELDEKVCVRRRAVLVPVHVLLKNAEVARELALRTIAANLREALRNFLLVTLDSGGGLPLLVLPLSFALVGAFVSCVDLRAPVSGARV